MARSLIPSLSRERAWEIGVLHHSAAQPWIIHAHFDMSGERFRIKLGTRDSKLEVSPHAH